MYARSLAVDFFSAKLASDAVRKPAVEIGYAATPNVVHSSVVKASAIAQPPRDAKAQHGDAELTVTASPELSASMEPRPQYLHGLTVSQLSWKDLDTRREWRRELMLRGLPRRLCEISALERILTENGLASAAARIRTNCPAGKRLGVAVIKVRKVADVAKIARVFHGRAFGTTMPVAVSFFEGSNPLRSPNAQGILAVDGPATLPVPEVETQFGKSDECSGAFSSTNSGSVEEEEMLAAPPGLEWTRCVSEELPNELDLSVETEWCRRMTD